jgi:hypothetical protein
MSIARPAGSVDITSALTRFFDAGHRPLLRVRALPGVGHRLPPVAIAARFTAMATARWPLARAAFGRPGADTSAAARNASRTPNGCAAIALA